MMLAGNMMYFAAGGRKRTIKPYDRDKAVRYAHRWAYGRNPAYYDFEKLGGDCTNFASQCIYAGSGIMNHTPVYGWYYINSYNRTASWTGVNYLYNFLINNRGAGPFAEEVDISDVQPGDIAQLSFADSSHFHHSPVIVKVSGPPTLEGILVAAHTFDTDYYPLVDFKPAYVRFLHIAGVRI